MKGRVAEVKEDELIVLTRKGEFIAMNKPKTGIRVGEEIKIESIKRVRSFPWKLAVSGLVACLVLVAMLIYTLNAAATPVAYLTLDINPSMEIAVGANGNVVGVSSLNDDAMKILGSIEKTKGVNPSILVRDIINQAAKMGYLNSKAETNILVSVTAANVNNVFIKKFVNVNQIAGDLKKEAQNEVEVSAKQDNVLAQVTTVEGNASLRSEAQKLGLSTGKYIFLQGAVKLGYDVNAEELKSKSIAKVIKEDLGIGVPGQLISRIARMNHGQEQKAEPDRNRIDQDNNNSPAQQPGVASGKGAQERNRNNEQKQVQITDQNRTRETVRNNTQATGKSNPTGNIPNVQKENNCRGNSSHGK